MLLGIAKVYRKAARDMKPTNRASWAWLMGKVQALHELVRGEDLTDYHRDCLRDARSRGMFVTAEKHSGALAALHYVQCNT